MKIKEEIHLLVIERNLKNEINNFNLIFLCFSGLINFYLFYLYISYIIINNYDKIKK